MSVIDARFKGMLGSFALDTNFIIPANGVTCLFGPSGCGKTTVLRCLAGLVELPGGYLNVGGVIWQDSKQFRPPYKRPVGYVFQEPRLFPHLSVLDNLKYGLRRAGPALSALTLDSIVDLMGISTLLSRSPVALSGGERQRVAIGRAVLSQPRLLLMDEPISALDRDAKNEILPYLETLTQTLAIPIIYVTHDFAEVERLADHLVLFGKNGRALASGALQILLSDISLPIARLPVAAMVLSVTIEGYDPDYGLTSCSVGGARFLVPGDLGPAASIRRLRIRASDVSLAKSEPQDTSVLNILPARIISFEEAGANQVLILLGLDEAGDNACMLSSVTRKSWDMLGLRKGSKVFAQVKGMALADAR
jgi:molybdate transport system ATP-binding protein